MNHDHDNGIETTAAPKGRRGLTIGLASGLLAGTAAGLVFGVPGLSSAAADSTPAAVVQQTDDTTSTDPATPPAPADAPDAPDTAEMGTKLREVLQPLVDDGTITAAQADAVTQHIVANRPERGPGGPGGFGERGGPGGFGGFGEDGGPGGRRGGPFAAGVASEALTDLLGIDAQALHTQLHDGSTLAEIATANGVEPQAVVDVLVAELQERLDNAVADGRIDQAEADQKLADAQTKITDMVNNGRPEGGPHDDAADAPTAD